MSESFAERARRAAAACALLIAAALFGLGVAEHARATRPPPQIEVRVREEVAEGDSLEAFVARVADAYEETEITWRIGSTVVQQSRRTLGAEVDRALLTARLADAFDTQSLARRYALGRGARTLDLPMPVRVTSTTARELLLERREELDRPAVSARIEARTGRIIEEQEGLHLDVVTSLADLARALGTEGVVEVEAVVERARPERTRDQLREVRIDAVVGTYETHYSTLEQAANRSYNLRVAASKIDGTVLFPGETFDFNAVVGERSEANGFRPAPQIADGELVDGVGGGTCQIAGTLHSAAFFAGLPITERSPHSRPSSYVWMGLDAAVSYPRINLEFTNDLPYPIVIGMTVEGGIVRAELRGPSADRRVSFTRRIDGFEAFGTRDVADPSLPAGVRVLRQRGVPGFRITRFRTIRDVTTGQARRQRLSDSYPPTEEIWRVGSGAPAPAGFVAPTGDEHPEYTADEYMTATTTPGTNSLDIVRRAGRTGVVGWIDAAGLRGR